LTKFLVWINLHQGYPKINPTSILVKCLTWLIKSRDLSSWLEVMTWSWPVMIWWQYRLWWWPKVMTTSWLGDESHDRSWRMRRPSGALFFNFFWIFFFGFQVPYRKGYLHDLTRKMITDCIRKSTIYFNIDFENFKNGNWKLCDEKMV
jgi:hypothetical protein